MNLRALRYCFCPLHNATEMFRDNVCLACEREGLIKTPPKSRRPTYLESQSPIGTKRSVWQRSSARARNEQRLATALNDPRVKS